MNKTEYFSHISVGVSAIIAVVVFLQDVREKRLVEQEKLVSTWREVAIHQVLSANSESSFSTKLIVDNLKSMAWDEIGSNIDKEDISSKDIQAVLIGMTKSSIIRQEHDLNYRLNLYNEDEAPFGRDSEYFKYLEADRLDREKSTDLVEKQFLLTVRLDELKDRIVTLLDENPDVFDEKRLRWEIKKKSEVSALDFSEGLLYLMQTGIVEKDMVTGFLRYRTELWELPKKEEKVVLGDVSE